MPERSEITNHRTQMNMDSNGMVMCVLHMYYTTRDLREKECAIPIGSMTLVIFEGAIKHSTLLYLKKWSVSSFEMKIR